MQLSWIAGHDPLPRLGGKLAWGYNHVNVVLAYQASSDVGVTDNSQFFDGIAALL